MSAIAASLILLSLVTSGSALAQGRSEATQHFDRGVRLWKESDLKNALEEFRRSYALDPEPAILYNVGFVQAQLDLPVDAVATFDKVLANPAKIPPENVALARTLRDQQAAHIGRVLVLTNVAARLTVDGVAVGNTPMGTPLSLAQGWHWLAAIADGHAPQSQGVNVIGGQQTEVTLALSPIEGPLAQLVVSSQIPGAEVVLDGSVVGKTPLHGLIAVTSGVHEVILRRSGYREARETMTLAGGASQTLNLEPVELEAASEQTSVVGIVVSEPDATVEIDGRPRPDYRQGLRLPVGVHRMTVTRTGFFPVEREIVSNSTLFRSVKVTLEPTEETRVAYVSRATNQRRWAWATIATGALLGGVSAYFYFDNRSELRVARSDFEDARAMLAPGGQCGPTVEFTEHCAQVISRANDRLDHAEHRRDLTLIGLGVGTALLATGVVVRLLAADPHRYDFDSPAQDPQREGLHLLAGAVPGGMAVALSGQF
jgi:hypothetical protein